MLSGEKSLAIEYVLIEEMSALCVSVSVITIEQLLAFVYDECWHQSGTASVIHPFDVLFGFVFFFQEVLNLSSVE